MDPLAPFSFVSPFWAVVLFTVATALQADWAAFKKMQSYAEFITYRWGVAFFNAFKGFAIGVVGALSTGLRPWLVLLVLVSGLSAGCGARTIPQVPSSIPATVELADSELRAGTAYGLQALDKIGDILNDGSQIRAGIQADGLGTPAQHAVVSAQFVKVANLGLDGVSRLRAGVKSWAELKAILDPLLGAINPLIGEINALGGSFKARLKAFGTRLANAALELIASFLRPGDPTRTVLDSGDDTDLQHYKASFEAVLAGG